MILGGSFQAVWIITCTSDMSGRASRGIRRILHKPASSRTSVPVKTRKRLRAHQSIQRVITHMPPSASDGELLLGDGLIRFGRQDGDLPGPAHLHLARAFVAAAALVAERHHVP